LSNFGVQESFRQNSMLAISHTFHNSHWQTGRQRLWTRRHHRAIRTWIPVESTQDDSVLVLPTTNIQIAHAQSTQTQTILPYPLI